ncbi:MAG: cytochrome-c peroxidase [Rhodopila sp.]
MTMRLLRWPVVVACLMAPAHAADGPALPWPPTPPAAAAYARASAIAELGRTLFVDPALSASGRMACATCHDPAHGFAAPNADPVQMGGADLRRPGVRAVPGLTYGAFAPPFQEHAFDPEDDGNDSIDQGPAGGRDWDGRVDRARDQAAIPLLGKNEMAMPDRQAVVAAASQAGHAGDLQALYGQDVLTDAKRGFAAVTEALEFYQQTQAAFSPFSSRYDADLHGTARLSAQEARGLALFNDPARGNCASCHPSAVSAEGKPPLFTDFGFAALGVPQNRTIPTNNDPSYFDLGLCGPYRTDLAGAAHYCGLFKVPTLRNVALKRSLFHNGIVHSLRDAVAFYAERDTQPGKWYPAGPDGTVHPYDDLPAAYAGNVNKEAPFGGRTLLSDADVDDIVAFLETLTDGMH